MEYIVYILAAICCIMAVYAVVKAGLFKKKKKDTKGKAEKPKEEPKAEKSAEPAPDTSFKVSKKERLTRVSKKALKADSRTATIEPVFAKTKEPQEAPSSEIEISQKLSKDDEDLIEAIDKINTEERKVVSLSELKKQSELEKQVEKTEQKLNTEGIKTIDGGRKPRSAGEVTGEYTNISIGRGNANPKAKKSANSEDVKTQDDEEELDFDKLFKSHSPFDSDFNPFKSRNRFFNPEPQPQEKPKKFDIGDAVQAEAILNPKFKNKNKK